MNVGKSSLYDIGSNYSIKLKDKELETEKESESGLNKELSEGEEQLVENLEARDAEVRAHESAHQAVAGSLAGAASFTYQQGPDGKMYAIGGEVPISMKTGSTPEETLANARKVASAAMAAGEPSPQDFAVASTARVMEMKAQQQLANEQNQQALAREAYSPLANSQTYE